MPTSRPEFVAVTFDPPPLPEGWEWEHNPDVSDDSTEATGIGPEDVLVRSPTDEVMSYAAAAKREGWDKEV